MAQSPGLVVEIAFNTGSALGTQLVLDDPTKGVMDETYTLAAPTYADVTSYISGQATWTRGRQRETDQFSAGEAHFTLRNESRAFDPINASSPYYPGILPGAAVRILVAGEIVFWGRVDDYQVDYDLSGTSVVNVTCYDGLGMLAGQFLYNWSAVAEFPQTRIPSILGSPNVAYPDPYQLIGLVQDTLLSTITPDYVATDSQGNVYVTCSTTPEII